MICEILSEGLKLDGSRHVEEVLSWHVFGRKKSTDKSKGVRSRFQERDTSKRTPITLTDHIESLGVTFDTRLSFDKYVGEVCKGCYYHIHGLHHVRAAMSVDTANMVACAIISARLDYCNLLFSGMSDANFDKIPSLG